MLAAENAQIFPLVYKTDFRIGDGDLLEGVFDPF
jgi:hypothetical protein